MDEGVTRYLELHQLQPYIQLSCTTVSWLEERCVSGILAPAILLQRLFYTRTDSGGQPVRRAPKRNPPPGNVLAKLLSAEHSVNSQEPTQPTEIAPAQYQMNLPRQRVLLND